MGDPIGLDRTRLDRKSTPDGVGPSGDGSANVPAETPPAKKKKGGAATEDERDGLQWSVEGGWQGFDDVLWDELAKAYPACDIRRQFFAMEQWLKSNPSKARKSNWRRFVTNWLQREQDRGGDLRGQPAPAWAGMAKPVQPVVEAGAPPRYAEAWAELYGTPPPAWAALGEGEKAEVRRWIHTN